MLTAEYRQNDQSITVNTYVDQFTRIRSASVSVRWHLLHAIIAVASQVLHSVLK